MEYESFAEAVATFDDAMTEIAGKLDEIEGVQSASAKSDALDELTDALEDADDQVGPVIG